MATGGARDLERGTDKTFDILCFVCNGKNIKNTEARKFCYECHDYYCSSCVKYQYFNCRVFVKDKLYDPDFIKNSSSMQDSTDSTDIADQSLPSSHDSEQQVGNSQTSQNDGRQSRSSLLQIKNSKKYKVRVKSDINTCYIVSACTLDDGTIILSDHSNLKLKRVDPSSFVVRDCCYVAGYPCQVCAISNTEVAVCCFYRKLIQFVAVGRKLKKTRQIDTDCQCLGLACAQGKLFVSSRLSVYVYTVSGDKLQRFDFDGLGESRLTVSSENLNMFISNDEKGLIIIDRNGSSIGEFNGPELQKASDIYLHSSSNIFVCGYGSKNVVQFSPDGKLIGEILNTENNCQAICCAKNNSELIVGFCNDEIEVYEISKL